MRTVDQDSRLGLLTDRWKHKQTQCTQGTQRLAELGLSIPHYRIMSCGTKTRPQTRKTRRSVMAEDNNDLRLTAGDRPNIHANPPSRRIHEGTAVRW